MLAPHIKKKVDRLWDRFWSAGLTNPLVAVEQITYLLFLKRLEDIDRGRVEKGLPSIYARSTKDEDAKSGFDPETCRWSYIRQVKTNPTHLIDTVFPWLRGLEARLADASKEGSELKSLHNRMADAYFQLDPNKGQVLADAINLIDELFARAGGGSSAQDIMGDTFEYLLSEVATAGKNGQFRTPRHLIRFMVELLDPKPGQRIIDPAAGTGGFLFSAQQYLQRKYTKPDSLRIEWDGAPHRTSPDDATDEQKAAIHQGANFVGLDNDRTMARIGWMNLILHGIDNPHLVQGDSLSKREGKEELAQLLTPQSYHFVLANPPFTGTVDSVDLEKDINLFPRAATKGKRKEEVITNKSELLFCWLMLDLLDVGGRCAVIVPEGVLFANTDAHISLRRELLTDHVVEGVISLPPGTFQPYTSVRTSILIFRKETHRDDKQKPDEQQQEPRTSYVWFYEVENDGYSLDAKRNPQPGHNNDLWDALVKFRAWLRGGVGNEKYYYQPRYWAERWRLASLRDTNGDLTPFGQAFSELEDVARRDGGLWAIHELFAGLPVNPQQAEEHTRYTCSKRLHGLLLRHFAPATKPIWEKWHGAALNDTDAALAEWTKSIKKAQDQLNKAVKDAQKYFDSEDSPALALWKAMVPDVLNAALASHRNAATQAPAARFGEYEPVLDLAAEINGIAREVAKVDGVDVTLRSLETDQKTEIASAKHWVVPVRDWARNDEWTSADGKVQGSHDAQGMVRPAYVQAMESAGIYDSAGQLKEGLLDPDCIEAREWMLSAGQFKPFDFPKQEGDKNLSELIGEVTATEQQIIGALDKLRAMVEGRE